MSTTPPPNPLNLLTPSQVNRAEPAQWRQLIRQELADLRVSSTAYLVGDMDAVHQTVTVQIAQRERVRTNAGPKWVAIPPITNVPVCLPRGGGYCVTLPLKDGDEGQLIFCDTCFDLWWTRGGLQNQLEVRRHHVHDCGFYPGMGSQPKVLSNYSTESLQVRSDDGTQVIDVAASGITVTATQVTVTGSSVTLGTATTIDGRVFLNHTHSGVQTGSGATGKVV